MEKIQVIQPTKLLAPYIKQYWLLRIDDVKQGFQRSIPAGCVALVFHKGNKIISFQRDCVFFANRFTGSNDQEIYDNRIKFDTVS